MKEKKQGRAMEEGRKKGSCKERKERQKWRKESVEERQKWDEKKIG